MRSRSMMGFRTPFVPGWDCHGMPIEFKVSRDARRARRARCPSSSCASCAAPKPRSGSTSSARISCASDASATGSIRTSRWRIEYDAAEIGVLRNLVERGYVYRGLRPVHWCFDDRTALAEAEVEYREHMSPSIYVDVRAQLECCATRPQLAADHDDGAELAAAHKAGKLFAVIWTTTPWTLPANLGISSTRLSITSRSRSGEHYYIVARRLAEAVDEGMRHSRSIKESRSRARTLKALDGQDIFRHPFLRSRRQADVRPIMSPPTPAPAWCIPRRVTATRISWSARSTGSSR